MFEILGYIFVVVLIASLLFHIVIYFNSRNKDNPIVEIERKTSFYISYNEWRIIPSIEVCTFSKFLEVSIQWLKFVFYTSYTFVRENDN